MSGQVAPASTMKYNPAGTTGRSNSQPGCQQIKVHSTTSNTSDFFSNVFNATISEGLRRVSLLCYMRCSATFLWGPNIASAMQVDSLTQTCVLSATFFISLHLFSHRGEGCSYTLIVLTLSNTGIFYRKKEKKTLLRVSKCLGFHCIEQERI